MAHQQKTLSGMQLMLSAREPLTGDESAFSRLSHFQKSNRPLSGKNSSCASKITARKSSNQAHFP